MHLWPGLIAWIFGVITFLPLNNDVMRGDQQVAGQTVRQIPQGERGSRGRVIDVNT
jgi:hypothetical protein